MNWATNDVASRDLAVVVIGRNEGERLLRCLRSVQGAGVPVIYVDSGSTDGSVDAALRVGATVHQLDLSEPFTAARARNAGARLLLEKWPHVAYVQFVDGDCEIEAEWLPSARAKFVSRPDVAVVFGRRRERFPEQTIFNRLCDLEWDVPIGEVRSCGGDAMFRVDALRAAGGYREDLIAGEEPELCVRLRGAGWKVLSTGVPMTVHDAAMTRFGQWWRRSVRCGWAFAAGAHLHGRTPERHFVAEARRGWLWAGLPPLAAMVLTVGIGPAGLLPLLVYPAQVVRLYIARRRVHADAAGEAFFLVAGKFPEVLGQLRFYKDLIADGPRRLIEYKSTPK
jgi:hypothetical protein